MTLLHGNGGDLWKSNYQQWAAPAYNLLVHFTAYLDINYHWMLRNSGPMSEFFCCSRSDRTVSWPSMFSHEPAVSKRSPQGPTSIKTGPSPNNPPTQVLYALNICFLIKNRAWNKFCGSKSTLTWKMGIVIWKKKKIFDMRMWWR